MPKGIVNKKIGNVKLNWGKSVEQIADEPEETPERIRELMARMEGTFFPLEKFLFLRIGYRTVTVQYYQKFSAYFLLARICRMC